MISLSPENAYTFPFLAFQGYVLPNICQEAALPASALWMFSGLRRQGVVESTEPLGTSRAGFASGPALFWLGDSGKAASSPGVSVSSLENEDDSTKATLMEQVIWGPECKRRNAKGDRQRPQKAQVGKEWRVQTPFRGAGIPGKCRPQGKQEGRPVVSH